MHSLEIDTMCVNTKLRCRYGAVGIAGEAFDVFKALKTSTSGSILTCHRAGPDRYMPTYTAARWPIHDALQSCNFFSTFRSPWFVNILKRGGTL